ncbi:hypothetical protein QVD17_16225 [Tagetes erecta]|uniref:AIG1-type G domain-containing protein n=1 Tax=Tagetes erecta TaxID=13708 RepID=A0AAD8KTV3_TARER|nr:hypothetical protein QVD17_16225 [Tagetes erecta]
MGGCSCDYNCEHISPTTIVLVGKTGNGKSATGNSIFGKKVLESKKSSSGVTITSELHVTTLEDGQLINVIDTPGLFDASLDFEFIGKEIVKCISMAKDGIDAFLVVVSTSRFSEEEEAAISSLQTLFGNKVYDYMIVVFTGGDELEDENQTLDEFLFNSPEALKQTLNLCENRYVLFDNKTKVETKRLNQVKKLLSLVDMVATKNGGKRYTNEIFTEMKNQTEKLKGHDVSLDDERFKHIYEMIESRLKETHLKLERQLAEERVALSKAEKKAQAAQKKLDEEKQKLKESLKKVEKNSDEKRKLKEKLQKAETENKKLSEKLKESQRERERQSAPAGGGCFIL